jgi:hypothetical protein
VPSASGKLPRLSCPTWDFHNPAIPRPLQPKTSSRQRRHVVSVQTLMLKLQNDRKWPTLDHSSRKFKLPPDPGVSTPLYKETFSRYSWRGRQTARTWPTTTLACADTPGCWHQQPGTPAATGRNAHLGCGISQAGLQARIRGDEPSAPRKAGQRPTRHYQRGTRDYDPVLLDLRGLPPARIR